MVEIIRRKRDGGKLSAGELEWFVGEMVAGRIPEYQTAALLMALWIRGMDPEETVALTMAMARSGDMADLSAVPGVKVDKHSTGGVGDTTTLVVAPMVAACGVKVAKLSGKGLSFTGGTLDKLESIPGFRTQYSVPEWTALIRENGLAVAGQSARLAPADGILYALRDVTATVDSLPLIASSIMSKKLAAGCDGIVLDVKVGEGAFMRTLPEAKALAEAMVQIGRLAGRPTVAVVTDMNQPLGCAVGNALEVREALEVLRGAQGPLTEVCLLLGAEMLRLAGVERPRERCGEALRSGAALERFRAMVRAQGGDERVVEEPGLLPAAARVIPFPAERGGYVAELDAREIGEAAMLLGAGRARKEDAIDPAVGLVLRVRRGDRVEAGQPLLDLHVNDGARLAEARERLRAAIRLGAEKPAYLPAVSGILRQEGWLAADTVR